MHFFEFPKINVTQRMYKTFILFYVYWWTFKEIYYAIRKPWRDIRMKKKSKRLLQSVLRDLFPQLTQFVSSNCNLFHHIHNAIRDTCQYRERIVIGENKLIQLRKRIAIRGKILFKSRERTAIPGIQCVVWIEGTNCNPRECVV